MLPCPKDVNRCGAYENSRRVYGFNSCDVCKGFGTIRRKGTRHAWVGMLCRKVLYFKDVRIKYWPYKTIDQNDHRVLAETFDLGNVLAWKYSVPIASVLVCKCWIVRTNRQFKVNLLTSGVARFFDSSQIEKYKPRALPFTMLAGCWQVIIARFSPCATSIELLEREHSAFYLTSRIHWAVVPHMTVQQMIFNSLLFRLLQHFLYSRCDSE